MFTGIIQAVGQLRAREAQDVDARLSIASSKLELAGVKLGDSIAVNGVCLTVTRLEHDGFWADVSAETLRLTTLGQLAVGAALNLEKALTLNQPLGGHLLNGHVDGLGQVVSITPEGRSLQMEFAARDSLARYIARKGSIAIDGVSLTVNQVQGRRFSVNLVPHSLQETSFGALTLGASVNLEVDLLARYLERLFEGQLSTRPGHAA
ncbi:MAG: riboflavin synthase [Nevskiales bacterium]